MVGVNKYKAPEAKRTMDTLYIDRTVEKKQADKVKALRSRRDNAKWLQSIEAVKKDAQAGKNMMPSIIEAVKNYATLGEVCDTLRGVYGIYRDVGSF